jgi:hypothetical protein
MIHKLFSTFILSFLLISTLNAKHVTVQKAKVYAQAYFIEHYNVANERPINRVNLDLVKTKNNNTNSIYYIFNEVNNNGWIIISADDIALPVLAYSFENNYDLSDRNKASKYFLQQLEYQIEYAQENKVSANQTIINEWLRYDNKGIVYNAIANVNPLLTTNWDQDCYYNMYCPQDYSGYCNRALTGCVATSMAQIINFHEYPSQGMGSHSYVHSVYGTLSANFGSTTYDYANMPSSLSSSTPLNKRQAVGRLMSDCGISVDMNYGPNGSGSNTSFALTAFKNYFKYDQEATEQNKDDYSILNFMALLRNSLDQSNPILYSGTDYSLGYGHAWVCDGYQSTSMFHMNWGWSGSNNGYYQLNNLTASSYDFTDDQAAIINLHPLSSNPCSGAKTYTSISGNLDDGSSFNNYQNNKSCQWLINPSTGTDVVLTFSEFNTELNNDVVKIYNGSTTSSPLIATISGNNNPGMIIANSGQMLITFTTNGSITKSGWKASWTNSAPTSFCGGMKLLTSATETFEDGSGMYNDYYNNTNCKWMLRPTGANIVSIVFNRFDLESGDKILIYNGPTSSSPLLANFNSSNPPTSVQSTQGTMLVVFQTNAASTAKGWEATYYKNSAVSVKELHQDPNINIFPNPAEDNIELRLENNFNRNISIEIYNALGKNVKSMKLSGLSYNDNINIPIDNLSSGIFFIRIYGENYSSTLKFIKK